MTGQQIFENGIAAHRAGRIAEAEGLYRQALALMPASPGVRHCLGLACHQQGRNEEALRWIDAAAQAAPNEPAIPADRGVVLQAMGRREDALKEYDRAIAMGPPTADTLNNRGNTLLSLGRTQGALDMFTRAVTMAPGHAQAWNNRGNALRTLRRLPEALESFERALALAPQIAAIWVNAASVLCDMGRLEESLGATDRALRLDADSADAWNGRGATLIALKRQDQALAALEQSLARNPGKVDAWFNRGTVLLALKRTAEALASFERAVALDPGRSEAMYSRSYTLRELGRVDEAIASFELLHRADPGDRHVLGGFANLALSLCDWPRLETLRDELAGAAAAGKVLPPLLVLAISDDPARQREAAALNLRDGLPVLPPPLWQGAVHAHPHDRIRVAYLSGDFHSHATAFLAAELFERHDRARFEVTGVSYGPDDHGPVRARLEKAFDRFIDAAHLSDFEVARMLHEMQIDIAVDLKGHTLGARPAILAHRPAPVQVNYLGYPGTLGAPFIDYVIGDAVVLPMRLQAFYDEKIVHLPFCYQPNDSRRIIAAQAPTRAEAGLPQDRFVFCCFNNNWKITPETFAVWMRLLQAVPDSVLWLLEDNGAVKANLRRAAAAAGVAPERLVFAPRVALDIHLARHRLADLFLDTLPYNAHTTASDALWAGLPLVTMTGGTFAGRVAASLLTALGLCELVTGTAHAYEALALALARDPARLAAIRARLADARGTSPLFDGGRIAADLERAYARMREIAAGGGAPQSFAVPAAS